MAATHQIARLPLAALPWLLAPAHVDAQAHPWQSPDWVDYDGDGRIDLALVEATGTTRLYRNEPTGFRDVTEETGLARLGPARLARWSDFDADRKVDLLRVDGDGAPALLRSAHGSFEELDALLATRDVVAAEWTDVDADGWSDLWLCGAGEWTLYRNRGGGSFESVSSAELAAPAIAAGPLAPAVPRAASEVAAGFGAGAESAAGAPRSIAGPPIGASGAPGASALGLAAPARLPAAAPDDLAASLAPDWANCARTLYDAATGTRLSASSAPALGTIYPLSTFLNLDTTGRVGMGMTSPSHQLTVQSASDDTLRLIGAGFLGSHARLNFGDGDYAYLYEDVDDSLEIHTTGRTALTGGNVGIGTTSPTWPLHVVSPTQAVGRFDSNSSSFGSAIELRNNTANPADLGAINFADSLSQLRGQVAYKGVEDALTLSAGGAERLRIAANGYLGIATSTPEVPVDVRGVAIHPEAVLRVEETGGGLGTAAIDGRTSGVATVGLRGTTFGVGSAGVAGIAYGSSGYGVVGTALEAGGHGVEGTATSGGYGVLANGDLGATGGKFFLQPHPSDPSKEIRFTCLEGNESGTYFRGTARLAGGRAEIEVPEEFRLVSEPEGITVQVTALGWPALLAVESRDLERVVVVGTADVEFDYFVNGVRRGFKDLDLVVENHHYVPKERGVPFGTQYPEDLRKILVENGILNADFTPNEVTAASLGWILRDPSRAAASGPAPRR